MNRTGARGRSALAVLLVGLAAFGCDDGDVYPPPELPAFGEPMDVGFLDRMPVSTPFCGRPAVDGDGLSTAAAWYTDSAGRPRVLLAFSSDAGKTYEAPIQVAASGGIGRAVGCADVVLAPDGSALVSWLHEREGMIAVMLAAVDPVGNRVVTVVEPRASLGIVTGMPRVTLGADRVLVAWPLSGEPDRIRIVEVPLIY